jgi:hypothetical protein
MAAATPGLRYHCVSIVAKAQGCAAAKQLKGVRMLSAEAPRLPLPGCERGADCDCTYRHHDDRRAGPRRAEERGRLAGPWSMTDRRHRGGRRATDFDD